MDSQVSIARDGRARRAAKRQDLAVTKAKLYDPRATLYNTYGLVDRETRQWVAWGHPKGYGLSFDEIEEALDARPSVDRPFVRTRDLKKAS